MDSLVSAVVEAIERGWMPDLFTRWGIRRLLRQRLHAFRSTSPEQAMDELTAFLASCRSAEIAPVPEKANQQHYETPARFFELMLGPRRKYSSCFFADASTSLSAAEDTALATTCARAEIQDGMTVLDLGCGWGSFTLYAAEKFPLCKIVGVSNSHSQREAILAIARERGFGDRVEILTADMNTFDLGRQVDRVVSIEMFEHMRNHEALLGRIAGWLRPAGKLFVHIFCHREFAYAFETEGASNWMGRHFFTGGIMPSDDLLARLNSPLQLQRQWRWNGQHYQRTLEAWLVQLDRREKEAVAILQTIHGADAKRWFLRWRLFLLACSELFGFRAGAEWWVSHYVFAQRESYST